MILTVHGCGYNGFSQLSGLQSQNLEGWSHAHNRHENKKLSRKSTVVSPINLIRLDQNVHVKNAVFTWSQIAITLKKDKRNVSLISGGIIANSTQEESSLNDSTSKVVDGTVVAATDTQIFLKLDEQEAKLAVWNNNETQTRLLSVQNERPDTARLELYSCYRDVYYTRGSMEFGKLESLDSDSAEFSCSVQLSPLDASVQVAEVSCGREHVLLLSRFGSIYSCGLGSRGQLGHGDVEEQVAPRLLEALEGVRMLRCKAGGWHSVCVSEYGDAYSWGWDSSGQLGLGHVGTPYTQVPQEEDSREQVQEENRAKQSTKGCDAVAQPQTQGVVTEPRCVNSLPEGVVVKDVACGSRHTLLLTECGQVYATGWNTYGQLGLAHTTSQSMFKTVTGLGSKCAKIFAGHWSSIFVCHKS